MTIKLRFGKKLLVFVGVVFFFAAKAQLFNHVYQQDRPSMLFSSVLYHDSGYIVNGVTSSYQQPYYGRAIIGSIDGRGNFGSYKSISDSANKLYGAFSNGLIALKKSGYAFTGYSYDSLPRVLFAKFDTLLDTVRVFEYQPPFSYAFQGEHVIENEDGTFYIAGVRTDSLSLRSNVLLIKLDSNGNRLWEKYYGGGVTAENSSSFIKLKNGNLMIGSGRRDLNQAHETAHTWLLQLDTAGNMVKEWFDPNDSTYTANGLKQTKDGGFMYGAQKKHEQTINDIYCVGEIVKLDSAFHKMWAFQSEGVSPFTGVFDIEELSDGGFIACGNIHYLNSDSTIISGWIFRMSSNGNLLWQKNYEGVNQSGVWNFLYDIDILPDGNYIACGEVQRSSKGQQGWLLKIDSNGCEVENCLLGVDEISTGTQVVVSPNPFTTDIAISVQKDGLREASFTIYNMLGQPVYTRKETNLSSSYTKMLDLRYLPNGIYFVEVVMDGEKVVRQVVKQ